MNNKFDFYPTLRAAWIDGYNMGHRDGNDCGQSYSTRCRHDAEREWLESDVFDAVRRETQSWFFGEQRGETRPDTSDPAGT